MGSTHRHVLGMVDIDDCAGIAACLTFFFKVRDRILFCSISIWYLENRSYSGDVCQMDGIGLEGSL